MASRRRPIRHRVTTGPNGHLHIEIYCGREDGSPGSGFMRTFEPHEWPQAAVYLECVMRGRLLGSFVPPMETAAS